MANKFRSFVQVILDEQHRLFNNAKSTVDNVTGRAHEKVNKVQNTVALKYDTISKKINNEIIVFQNLNAEPLESRSQLPHIIVKWWKWYQELTGLDAVELSKRQMILAQDKLFKCQDDRRQLNRQVTKINDHLKEIYGELIQIKRDDPRYVQLTIIENKSLQEQAKIMGQLNLLEKEEKDHFTLLATAIKEYHDSQALNAQKYKYLSILASAAIAIVSLTGSMIYNNKRIKDVQNIIAQAQEKNEIAVNNSFSTLDHKLNARFSEILEKLEHKNSISLTKQDNNEEAGSKQNSGYLGKLTYPIVMVVSCIGYLVSIVYR